MLSADQRERYSRQLIFEDFNEEKQFRLLEANIFHIEIDCVRRDINHVPSVADGMHVFEIIDAAERSAQSGGQLVHITP